MKVTTSQRVERVEVQVNFCAKKLYSVEMDMRRDVCIVRPQEWLRHAVSSFNRAISLAAAVIKGSNGRKLL